MKAVWIICEALRRSTSNNSLRFPTPCAGWYKSAGVDASVSPVGRAGNLCPVPVIGPARGGETSVQNGGQGIEIHP